MSEVEVVATAPSRLVRTSGHGGAEDPTGQGENHLAAVTAASEPASPAGAAQNGLPQPNAPGLGELPPEPHGLTPAAVAAEAAQLHQEERLRNAITRALDDECRHNARNAEQQYQQAVLWRRINLGLGLAVGLLAAASGTVGVVGKSTLAAAILGAAATFGTGALTTLNAGQRKGLAAMAGAGYRELEAAAERLRHIQLPYAPLADVLGELESITLRRLQISRGAEAPSARAFRRAARNEQEIKLYRRELDFAERHTLAFWGHRPPVRGDGERPNG